MKLGRFLVPRSFLSLFALVKWGCRVSPRAELEWSRHLRLGRGVTISSFCKIKSSDGPLSIGTGTQVAPFCFITAHAGGVEIGNDCLIGPGATLAGNSYRYDDLTKPMRLQDQVSRGIRIGDDVWISAGCVVLDGADIGSGTIVTPNTVVSGRVPPNSVLQGNPAKIIFTRR
jgi:acetyltransferase-like isoleucine patch superfamily enzyme